jgi:hypothetical protein
MPSLAYARASFVENQPVTVSATVRALVIAGGIAHAAFMAVLLHYSSSRGVSTWFSYAFIALGVCVFGATIFVAFSRLRTIVHGMILHLRLEFAGVRIWSRDIPLKSIDHCEVYDRARDLHPVRGSPPGSRICPSHAWYLFKFIGGVTYILYSSSSPAVVLFRSDRGPLVVRSFKPDELADAIRASATIEPETQGAAGVSPTR